MGAGGHSIGIGVQRQYIHIIAIVHHQCVGDDAGIERVLGVGIWLFDSMC